MLRIPLIIAVLAAFPVSLAIPGDSFAQTAQECDIEESLQAFLSVKDQASGEPPVAPVEELRLQKALLEEIISCTEDEVERMAATLGGLGELDEEFAGIRDEFRETLESYRSTLLDDANRLRSVPELTVAKQFAKDLFVWREETYRPALQEMLALSYIVRGKESLGTGEARLLKINAALRTLGLSGNRELRALLEKAAQNLKDAKTLNEEARGLFFAAREPAPEEEKQESEDASAPAMEESATSTEGGLEQPEQEGLEQEEEKEAAPEAKDVARDALVKIRDAYRLFVNVSETVSRIFR